jgi:hypothetical protein
MFRFTKSYVLFTSNKQSTFGPYSIPQIPAQLCNRVNDTSLAEVNGGEAFALRKFDGVVFSE